MTTERRWLEIAADGTAFHERYLPAGVVPPAEVYYCDCRGVGRETWNPQTAEGSLADWLAAHADCVRRRQIFVDVTDAPSAQLDVSGATQLRYDEVSRTFTTTARTATRVRKTVFLAALGPDLLAAWFASTDPILVFGRELFKADTTVDLDSAVITQVLARGVALGLVKPDAAAAVQASITALATTA